MSGLEEAGARAAARRVLQVRRRLAAALADELPSDVAVTEDAGGVVVTGRALTGRALRDPRLRGWGLLARGTA